MNWKHMFWIIPFCLILGYLVGMVHNFYISIPEEVTITMGYEPETLRVMEKITNQTFPEPEKINVTLKEAKELIEVRK
jgi:hypothetical protein